MPNRIIEVVHDLFRMMTTLAATPNERSTLFLRKYSKVSTRQNLDRTSYKGSLDVKAAPAPRGSGSPCWMMNLRNLTFFSKATCFLKYAALISIHYSDFVTSR
jgi:hypothetical protein